MRYIIKYNFTSLQNTFDYNKTNTSAKLLPELADSEQLIYCCRVLGLKIILIQVLISLSFPTGT
jgi:hypothetical protein